MTEFSSLSLPAQRSLWRRIAEQAIRRWPIGPAAIAWLGYGSNAVFKVSTADGEYVLRLSRADRATPARLRSELQWLLAIRKQAQILAPHPLATSDPQGETLFATVCDRSMPPPHRAYACLFEYIDGRIKPARDLTADDAQRVGGYLGKLHRHGQFAPPAGFDRPRLDRGNFFGADSIYQMDRASQILNSAQFEVAQLVAQRVRHALARLDSMADGRGLIHADLLAKNIIFTDAAVGALDFDHCAWGYFLYDLAPLLWELKGERSADYAELEDALWTGYIAERPLDDSCRELLETLVAARQLASCHWLLENLHNAEIRAIAPDLVERRIAELEDFLTSGVLRRNTPTL